MTWTIAFFFLLPSRISNTSSCIITMYFHIYGLVIDPYKDLLPVGLVMVASLVEHVAGIAEGSNPQRERPEKFRPFSLLPKQCKKCNNEVHSLSFLLLMLLLLLLLLIIIIIIIIISGGSGSRSIVSIREF